MGLLVVMVVIVVATGALELASADGVCGDGFYGTSGGICCQLCPAGTFLITDCTIQRGVSACEVCPDGYFQDNPNNFPRCLKCTRCQSDEEVQACSANTDTECRCIGNFYEIIPGFCCKMCDPGTFLEMPCTENNGLSICKQCPRGTYTAIPNDSPTCMPCTPCEADEDIAGECTPTSNKVCKCKHGYYKPEWSEFCIMGPTSEPKPGLGPGSIAAIVVVPLLLAAGVATGLYVFRKKKERWPWQKPPRHNKPTDDQVLDRFRDALTNIYSDKEMERKIRTFLPKLVKAVPKNLVPLLNELQARNVLTDADINRIKTVAGNKGVYDAASELIDKVMNRGHRFSKLFWEVLLDLTDDYPRLLTIFEEILQETQPSGDRADESLMLESAT